ncbi:MAG: hypothetical protein QXY62_05850 [Candidatus Altiarchaeota archaeon]
MVLKREDTPESEIFGTEEALAKISLELLQPSDDKLKTVTDVVPSEIFGIPTILAIANIFNSNMARNWIRDFLLLRISRLRIGRTEFVIILSGIREFAEIKKKGKVTDLFAGLS